MHREGTKIGFSPSDLAVFHASAFAAWMDRWELERQAGRVGDALPLPMAASPAPLVAGLPLFAQAQAGATTDFTCGPDEPDADASVLLHKGAEHEEAVRRGLAAQGLVVRDLRTERDPVAATRAALAAGSDAVLYQGRLRDGAFAGQPDFLVRRDGVTPPRYEPVEAKLALAPKPEHLVQLCAYAELLAAVQGALPAEFAIVLGDGRRQPLRCDAYIHYFRQLQRAFLQFQRDFDPRHMPHPGTSAGHGRWSRCAEQIIAATDHVRAVANIRGSQIRRLEKAGVTTMTQLARLAPPFPSGLRSDAVPRLAQQARLQLASRGLARPQYEVLATEPAEARRGLALLPSPSPLDVFFDMEGHPLPDGQLEYLFGAVHVEGSETCFADWWALRRADERAAFEAFIDWVHARWQRDPGMHVYHYNVYETAALKRLMGQYGTRELELDDLLAGEVFVDLYRVVRQGLAIGTPGYSLKDIEPLYRPARAGHVKTAEGCMAAFERWLDAPDGASWQDSPTLRDIRDYNRIDCESTLELTRWLRTVQGESDIVYVPPPGKWTAPAASRSQTGTTDSHASGATGGANAAPASSASASAAPASSASASAAPASSASASTASASAASASAAPASEVSDDPAVELARLLAADELEDGAGFERASSRAVQRAIESEELAARVRARAAGDPETARVAELLAQLVGFHRRELKPAWWRKYERAGASEAELEDDLDALAGLERTATPPRALGRSVAYEYRFDRDQNTKLQAGDRCYASSGEWDAVEIADLDAAEGLVVLQPVGRTQLPARFHIYKDDIVRNEVLEDAVRRFAAAWADGVASAPAIVDFLHRHPPRILNQPSGPIVTPGTDLLDGVTRAVERLTQSTLCIQGPPGTGKTYTASHVILRLLERGMRVGVMANSHKAILNLMAAVVERAAGGTIAAERVKVGGDSADPRIAAGGIRFVEKNDQAKRCLGKRGTGLLLGATAFCFARPELEGEFDYLFVDEAGQVSVGNLVAAGLAARNLVLVGDQMQLAQPVQGAHPGESGRSTLDYLLQGRATIPDDFGVFLAMTHRMHPEVCKFVSDAVYEGRLHAEAKTSRRRIVLPPPRPGAARQLTRGTGIVWVPVEHQDNSQASEEEADVIRELVRELLAARFQDDDGGERSMRLEDVLLVAPYNMQVRLLQRRLPGASVGSVDRFQGLEAPAVIVSMCASSFEEVPRGLDFLLSPNRINVAISRAECLAIVVGSPTLLASRCTTLQQMERLDLYCRLVEYAAGGAPAPRA